MAASDPPPCPPPAGETLPRLMHSNQSITLKGAVRLGQPGGGKGGRGGGGGKDLAANASLFTCLVMDAPLEKLKLR